MVLVTKVDGSKQEFDRNKVINTCLRLRISREEAEEIADKIEGRLYDGIGTHKILQMVFAYAKKHRPEVAHRTDLRQAISLMRSKPDFEEFVRIILREHGYDVEPNKILEGGCVEHEIDAVARKGGDVFFVEAKHHVDHHSYTGLHVFLESFAAFEDLVEGSKLGKNNYQFTKLMVVCNTKISDHAKRYAECRGIEHIGWNYPEKLNLSELIESRKLYPITILKGLDSYTQTRLGDNNIVILKQLAEPDVKKLSSLGIGKSKAIELIRKAKALVES